MPSIKTKTKKFQCPECQNEVDFSAKTPQIKDVLECKFCGIEYEVKNVNTDSGTGETEWTLSELVESK